MLHDAVMLQVVVIGEASGRLWDAFRDGHPELPWKKIRATRNVVAHAYGVPWAGPCRLAIRGGEEGDGGP
jgi:uncharacterized protein with HEPN domain